MTALLGFADLLHEAWEENPQADGSRPSLDAVRRNGALLLGTINDLLDLSRLDAGRLPLERMRFSPGRLLDDLRRRSRPDAQARGIAVQVSIDAALPGWLVEDPVRVRQILDHLIGNALQWSGATSIQIALGPAAERGLLCWSVQDDGCGLRDRPEPQGEIGLQPIGNTGTSELGLRLCRRLAQALDGRLEIDSPQARGTRVRLILPLRPAPGEDRTAAESSCADALPQRLQARVLLVEDSPDNQRLIARVLSRAGAAVDIASNGADAIERVRAAGSTGYDIVLMDMQMPVMDGVTATRELRRLGFVPPIVALTAQTRAEARDTCLAAGCDDIVPKPIERVALIAALVRLLSPSGRA